MTYYTHTQISRMMIIITIMVGIFFAHAHITAYYEPVSENSGTNLAVTMVMICILLVLASLISLQVVVDSKYISIKFGFGIYQKKFLLCNICSVQVVQNRWYDGWGIRKYLWTKTRIYNIAGLDAVEITLNNNTKYRIGTDEPEKLKQAIGHAMISTISS